MQMPLTQSYTGPERRRSGRFSFLRRLAFDCLDKVGAFLFDIDLDTEERRSILFAICLGVAVVIFDIIAKPPPYIDGPVLRLPANLWLFLLWACAFWQIKARANPDNDFCDRRNANIALFFVLVALVGPLWIRGKALATVTGFIALFQCIVAVKFYLLCKQSDD